MQRDTRPLRQHDLRSDAANLIARATRAYIRRLGQYADQPGFAGSDIEHINGKAYVVLRNINGILAVYRVGGFDSLTWVEKDEYPEEFRHAS